MTVDTGHGIITAVDSYLANRRESYIILKYFCYQEAVYLADRVIALTNCPTKLKQEFIIDLLRSGNVIS